MTDIQRYTMSGIMTPVNKDSVTPPKWIQETDHIKAMEAKDESYAKLAAKLQARASAYNMECDNHNKAKKTISEQAKEIERMDRAFREKIKRINSRHDAITFKQEKEIERLKTELKKAQSKQADDDCKLCNWTCQKCGKYVEPENVLFDETHEGCGGVCL